MKVSYAFIVGAILLAISVVTLIRGLDASLSIPDQIYYTDFKHTAHQVARADFYVTLESSEKEQNSDLGYIPVNKHIPSADFIRLAEFPNSYSYPILEIDVFKLRQLTDGGAGVTVAVLDTGIDKNHNDLLGKVVGEINLTNSVAVEDSHGHGTHIAGIIAAENSNGVIGIAPEIRLLNVKIANDQGKCELTALENGIIWAIREGANVINVSVEIADHSAHLEKVINHAWENGVLVIAAAGNNGGNSPVYPAYYENTIAVTALGKADSLAPLANYGDWVDIAAPGFEVYSSLPHNNYGYKTGTSFATAYVSGVAALLYNMVTDKNDNGSLSDEVKEALETGPWQLYIHPIS